MKTQILLLLSLILLVGCQASGGGAAGDGIISGHTPADNKFTLTTTMNKTYLVGETINLVLTFPAAVTITGGTPSVDLTIGASTKNVPLTSGNGSAILLFAYTVVNGDDDLDGISVSTTLNKNGSSIKFDGATETSTIITVPNLSTVLVNTTSGSAPVAANITPAAFNEDSQSIMTLSYTDADSDQAVSCSLSSLVKVTVTQACACAAGVCTVGVTGTLNSNGAAGFAYTVTANSQVSNSATSTFTITPVADVPVAANITPAAFNEDVQSIITLSYTDGDADLATACAISSPTNVTVTQGCACAAGVCTVGVTGTANYSGAASFSYTVTANAQVSNSATSTFTINAVDDAPVASAITPAAFDSNTQSIITLLYSDVESHAATVCSISSPTNVTVTQGCACAAGTCTVGVTSTLNYSGAASFTYTVTANGLVSNSALASLTVNPAASAPVAANITPAAFNEDTQSVITLSYSDAQSDLATSCSISGLSNVTETQACACAAGICTVGVTGTADYNGAAGFNYTVTANSEVSNSATATLSITAVDDAPVAANFSPASFAEDVQSIITLQYADVDTDLATVCAISSPTNVTVTQGCACAAGACTVGVTGTANYSGAASFGFTVTANSVVSNIGTASLTITAVNDAPVAANITPSAFNEDVQSIITLSYTDTESDQATVCSLSSLSNVTVSQACACSAGTCTVGVTGTSNYNGAASFAYTVTANTQVSNSATATLSITAVADAPAAINLTPAAFNEDTASTINLSYTDAEGDSAVSCAVSGLTNITVSTACSCTLGACSVGVTGTSNYNGVASFTYTVTANSQTSASATASLTISSVEDAAVASNITPAAFNEDTQSIMTLAHTDVDSQSTSCSITSPSNVTVTQACACAAGVCTVGVTGTANYSGAGGFSFTVTSNSVASNTATSTFTINPVNDNPVISAIGVQTGSVNTAKAVTFTITDVDNTLTCTAARLSMTSSVTTLVPNASVAWSGTAPNCTATITPNTNATGTTAITFDVNDSAGGTTSANFNLTFNGVVLVWTNSGGTIISTYDFGDPNADTSVNVFVKNIGNQTSATVAVIDGGEDNRIDHTGTCTTLAAGATCPITILWEDANPAGAKTETYTGQATGAVSGVLNITGIR